MKVTCPHSGKQPVPTKKVLGVSVTRGELYIKPRPNADNLKMSWAMIIIFSLHIIIQIDLPPLQGLFPNFWLVSSVF